MLMNAQPVLLRPETLTLRDRPVRVVPPEEVIDSEALLKGRREILIQHGDRFYRLRHTSNDKLILTGELAPVEGTPLGERPPEDPLELVRMIATARILMPQSMVRLSAGRLSLSDEAQALCFLAGANSVFLGEKLLTTPNPESEADHRLFEKLGVRLREPEAYGRDTA